MSANSLAMIATRPTEAVDAMNDLYQNELRLWMNKFQPSVKLVKTVRRGSRQKRLDDAPLTPLDRLIASGQGRPSTCRALQSHSKSEPIPSISRQPSTSSSVASGSWRIIDFKAQNSRMGCRRISMEEKQAIQKISKIFGVKSRRPQ